MSDTLVAAIPGSTVGASKWHLGLINSAGPRFVVDVVGVQVDPSDAAAVTGTGTGFTLKRMSGLGTGTAVVLRKLDKSVVDAPAGITALSNLTTPTAEANPELASLAVNTEETAVTASGPSLWPPVGLEGQPVTLNNGDGIAVQQGALASAGAVDVFIYFRVRRKT
jgi:hypothetical protein